ncbi:hypothetical protein OHA21_03765 [Actinoplanes sp. NBC_00393]|uniref:hypothetical protein n=1 Tax=Actinoplanes sp. NBC_00393 TaxID=2975953 RepID=UPI002E216837
MGNRFRLTLAALCCGGLVGVSVLPHSNDPEPRPEPQPAPTAGWAPPQAVRVGVQIGRRCTPNWAIGRTAHGLATICGPDRKGRNRWRPLTPTAQRHLH